MSQDKASEYFRLFFETAQSILSAPALQPTLDSLVQRTVDALGVKAGSLRLIGEQSNNLEQSASHGLSRRYLDKGPLNADRSIPEVLKGKPVCVQNAYDDDRVQYRDAMRAEGINTVLSVPVIAGDKTIGVLRLYSEKLRDYSAEEIEFVAALAELGGLAIANARLYEAEEDKLAALYEEIGTELPARTESVSEQLEGFAFEQVDPAKSLEYFRTLHEVTQELLSTNDSDQVIQLIVEKVIDIMQVKASALRLLNDTTHEWDLLASCGLSEKFLSKGQPHTASSISETLEGKPVLILDTASDPRLEYPKETVAEGIASILSLPIVARSQVIGVLRLYSAEQRQYSQEEVTFLSAIAEIAGIAIMNARLYEMTRNDLSFWTATLGYLQKEA